MNVRVWFRNLRDSNGDADERAVRETVAAAIERARVMREEFAERLSREEPPKGAIIGQHRRP